MKQTKPAQAMELRSLSPVLDGPEAMMSEDLWAYLRDCPRWTPLSGFRLPVTHVDDSLYTCGASAFLVAVPYGADLIPNIEQGPFATMISWAASEGAARRVYLRQKEQDDRRKLHPPAEMLPPGCQATYVALLEAARAAGANPTQTASYRVVNDGAFLYRSIHAGRWNYHFRGRLDRPNEVPFVVECRLK